MTNTHGLEALRSLSSSADADNAPLEPQIDKHGRAYATGKRKERRRGVSGSSRARVKSPLTIATRAFISRDPSCA